MRNIEGIFLTHLHADAAAVRPASEALDTTGGRQLKVFGPGRCRELEPRCTLPGQKPIDVAVSSPANPMPGTADMTESSYQAFATDINDRIRDYHRPDIRSPNETPRPPMDPFAVFKDDRVRVSATPASNS